jgi:tetratricopeptide (TPR) repeat protein
MKFSKLPRVSPLPLFLGIALACVPAWGQNTSPEPSKPINLDEALQEPVPTDRAASYYHFALAQMHMRNGNMAKALSQMKEALKYNRTSSMVNLELAMLYEKTGAISEAIRYAQEAESLDPKDPDPHWLLARIYFKTQSGKTGNEFQKAVRELETIRDIDPENGNVYFTLGGAYFELDQPEKAIAAFEKFQEIVTTTDRGYREIANYYIRNNDPEKAVQYIKKAVELQPDSVESLELLGKLYTKLQQYEDAIPVYRKLLKLTDNDPDVKQMLAAFLYESGQYQEASDLLSEILKDDPEDADAAILLGRTQIGLLKFQEAIDTLQSVHTSDPRLKRKALFHLGVAYKNLEDYPKAIEVFTDLLSKTPAGTEENEADRFLVQYYLTSIYLKAKENDKALAIGKQEYDRDPDNLRTGIFYAQILSDTGKADEGAAILSRLLESNPSKADLYISLSQLYMRDKRYSKAEKILAQAENTELENGEDRIKILRVSVYEKQKEYDRAESLLKELIKVNPKNAGALNYLGYMLADRGIRLNEALDYVKKALEIDPENGAYLDSLGWAYFKMNDLENAEIYLLKAEQREREDPVINEHLGDLYFKNGDYEKARDFWMQSIRIATEEEDIQKVRQKLDRLPEKIRDRKVTK